MGLAEKRMASEFKESAFPGFKKQIDSAAGFEVAVEVNWESLATEGWSHTYMEAFPQVYFEPLIGALKEICVDDMGKEGLKATLKKIAICNTAEKYGTSAFSFEEGVLTIDHSPSTNRDHIEERCKMIRELIESKL
jgi:hypothetical protein